MPQWHRTDGVARLPRHAHHAVAESLHLHLADVAASAFAFALLAADQFVTLLLEQCPLRSVSRRRGAAVFVGLAQASRPRPGTTTAIFALVLALGIVSFSPMLRDAVAKGYKDAAHMKKDADLDPLRQREDYKKLVKELEEKK